MDIFWDSVDIYSPGLFPSGYTPEAYLSGEISASKPRNQLIARTLYRSGDIETYGTGLQRIKRECDEQGVPVEVFERGNAVHVRFMRSEGIAAGKTPSIGTGVHDGSDEFRSGSEVVPKNTDGFPVSLSEKELSACKFIAENGPARTATIAKAIGMSPRGTLKLLRRLTDQGILKVTGATSNRTYALRKTYRNPGLFTIE